MQRVVERSQTMRSIAGPAPHARRSSAGYDAGHVHVRVLGTAHEDHTKARQSCRRTSSTKRSRTPRTDFSDELRQQKEADRRAMAYVREMARRKELNEQLLHQLLRGKQTIEFIHAFARLADVDVNTVRRIVDTRNVEGVAVMCKAARFDRTTFSTIVLLLDPVGQAYRATGRPDCCRFTTRSRRNPPSASCVSGACARTPSKHRQPWRKQSKPAARASR